MMGMDAEVEGLRTAVSRYFSVTKVLVNPFAVTFHVTADPASLDETFDRLRRELVPKNYVPSIARENGGDFVHVPKRPGAPFPGGPGTFLLLFATPGATATPGGANWGSYARTPLIGGGFI